MLKDAFAEQVGAVREAVEAGENVAVVSEPYGGRGVVVDEAVDEDERISFSSVDGADESAESAEVPEEGVCLVDGPRYLYTRRVGGFAPLEGFVDSVAASDAIFVTSWNAYAWSYAHQAAAVGVLGEEVRVPGLGASETARFLADEYDVSEFEDDLEEVLSDEPPGFVDRLPPELGRLIRGSSDNLFERLTGVSGGNPGVARAVFEDRSWDDDTEGVELTDDEAFALRVVLSKETVGRDALGSVVRPRSLGPVVRRLVDAGFVEEDGGDVTLLPERLPDAVEHLERRRLVR